MAIPLDNLLDGTRRQMRVPAGETPVPYNTGVVPPGFGQPAPPPRGSLPQVPAPSLPATRIPLAQPTLPQPIPQTPVPQTAVGNPWQAPSLDSSAFVATATAPPGGMPGGAVPASSVWSGGPVDVGLGTTLPAAQASGDVVQQYLDSLLSGNSAYMTNAVRRGQEVAGARGLGNSTIAAGAAQRSAIEAAMPILDNIMSLHQSREGMSFQQDENRLQRELTAELQAQGFSFEDAQNAANRALSLSQSRESNALQREEGALDRAQSTNNLVLQGQLQQQQAAQDFEFRRTLQGDQVAQQDWLSSNQFNREFNAGLSMLPINNANQLSQMIAQYAMENPEVYTPDIAAGMTNFFSQNFVSMMAQYMPDLFTTEGA